MFTRINAFNIIPGAAFTEDAGENATPQVSPVWVAVNVTRSINGERVYVWARRGDLSMNGPDDQVESRAFDLDFCDQVNLVGLVVNVTDPDDNDWGN